MSQLTHKIYIFVFLVSDSICGLSQEATFKDVIPATDSRPNPGSVYDIPIDLQVPAATSHPPTAGKRVRTTTTGWENSSVYHTLYLPTDWKSESAESSVVGVKATYPVIVEYAGNGGYQRNGDTSHGTPEACNIGYGLSEGKGAIWICLPFVDIQHGQPQNSTAWWGDVSETKRYCKATVGEICQAYAGDPKRVLLAGFSRGALACNFIGLHDDEIAGLWCGMGHWARSRRRRSTLPRSRWRRLPLP